MEKRYVTDIIGDSYNHWSRHSLQIIATQTGSRKTTFVLEKLLARAASCGRYLIYICNRRTLNNQVKNRVLESLNIRHEYKSYFKIFTYQYCETSNKFPNFDNLPLDYKPSQQESYLNKFYGINNSETIPTEKIMYYVFDEAHYIVADSLINSGTNYWTPNKLRQEHAITVLLTSTPEALFCYLSLPRCDFSLFFKEAHKQYLELAKTRAELNKPVDTCAFDLIIELLRKQKFASLNISEESVEELRQSIINGEDDEETKAEQLKLVDALVAKPFFMPKEKMIHFRTQKQKRAELDKFEHPFEFAFKWIDNVLFDFWSPLNFCRFLDNVYADVPDYSYVNENYFDEYEDLYDKIVDSDQKWIIFVDSEEDGIMLETYFNYRDTYAVFLSSKRKNNTATGAKRIFEQIAKTNSFECKVLISTSVMDAGVSIDVDDTMNLVLSQSDKTEFIQMLGRCRVGEEGRVNLYIKLLTAGAINGCRAQKENNLRFMMDFYLGNNGVEYTRMKSSTLSKFSNNNTSKLLVRRTVDEKEECTVPIPPSEELVLVEIAVPESITDSESADNIEKIEKSEMKPDDTVESNSESIDIAIEENNGETAENVSDADISNEIPENESETKVDVAVKEDPSEKPDALEIPETILPDYELSKTALVHCLYSLRNLTHALQYKADYAFYLKFQLQWIGKEYDEHRWYNYDLVNAKLLEILENASQQDFLDAEQQKEFCKACLDCLNKYPKTLMPNSMRDFIKRCKVAQRRKETKLPGKQLLNSFFQYNEIGYRIISKQSCKKGRKMLWKIEKEQG